MQFNTLNLPTDTMPSRVYPTHDDMYPWHSHPATIARYCLQAADPTQTARYYCNILDFKLTLVHADGYLIERFGQSIFVGSKPEKGTIPHANVKLYVPHGTIFDIFYCIHPSAHISESLKENDDEYRFSIVDPDGNSITFCSKG